MAEPKYWVDLFTWSTWQQFLDAGASVSGFRTGSRQTVKQIRPGDYLICYVVRLARWIGVLEVTSEHYQDHSPIWKEDVFPERVKVKVVTRLEADTAVPLFDLEGKLTIFKAGVDRRAVGNYLRRSPTRLTNSSDGETLLKVLADAEKNPVHRPVDPAKLSWIPKLKLLDAGTIGQAAIPDDQETVPVSELQGYTTESGTVAAAEHAAEEQKEVKAHTEIQYLLLKLGSDMNLDVWVARNDRSRSFDGNLFAQLPRLKAKLPVQFDQATNRTIELIDVLWLKGNQIVAAFEIESTTLIYSGLLRMSDLIAMQPNLNIALYLVAPDERRDKVFTEVNRPTFLRLEPRLNEICRFVSFTTIRGHLCQLPAAVIRNLNADYMREDEVSESLLPDEV